MEPGVIAVIIIAALLGLIGSVVLVRICHDICKRCCRERGSLQYAIHTDDVEAQVPQTPHRVHSRPQPSPRQHTYSGAINIQSHNSSRNNLPGQNRRSTIYTSHSERQPNTSNRQPKNQSVPQEHPGLNKVKPRNQDVYKENNMDRPRNEIDLHGLHGDEVISVVAQCIRVGQKERFEHMDLITGQGNHSKDNIPVLKPAVEKYLKSRNMEYGMPNPGMFRVRLTQYY